MKSEAPVRPKRRRWLVPAIVALLLAGGGFVWDRQKAGSAPTAGLAATIPVTVVRPVRRDIPVSRSGLGTVLPLDQVDVKARADGTLQKISFVEGQEVKAGDLLAQIDPRPYQAALDQAKAALQKDLAQLASSRVEEERTAKLTRAGAGTSQAADNARAQVAINQGTIAGDQAALDTATINLGYTRIVAPISGRVGIRQVNEGSVVHASDATGIVTVTRMRPISVQFSLPQDDLRDLLTGQAKAPLAVSVDRRDGSTHLSDGKLTVIDSQVDTTTGMVRLKARFDNDDLALWPGQLVTASIVARMECNAVTVPADAVQNGQNGPYVYLVKPDDTVALSTVRTGPTVAGMTALASGVTPEDTVVLSGQSRLAPGTRVTTKQADAGPQKLAAGVR